MLQRLCQVFHLILAPFNSRGPMTARIEGSVNHQRFLVGLRRSLTSYLKSFEKCLSSDRFCSGEKSFRNRSHIA
jgi:hypothetical protein